MSDSKNEVIKEILDLQGTLQDLTEKVNKVKEEKEQFSNENDILIKYIDSIRHSSVIQKKLKEENNIIGGPFGGVIGVDKKNNVKKN